MDHRALAAPAPYCSGGLAMRPFRADAHAAGIISVVHRDGERVLRLAGEVDTATVEAFHARLGRSEAPLGPGDFSVVDVSDVTFMDCAGLRFLLRHSEAADTGRRPVVRGAPVAVRRILRLTGQESLLDVCA